MNNNGVSYPHPVLGVGDDIDSLCDLEPSITKDAVEYHIHFDLRIDNADILRLIELGYATFSCEINCPSTFYRRIEKSSVPYFDISIKRKDVAKRIDFECSVVVLRRIDEYTNSKFHEDFAGFSFQLDPGDVLAIFREGHYDVDIKYDKLRSAGSFMKIVKGDDEANTIYNLDSEKIEIQLPEEMYEDYKNSFNGNGKYANIFHSSLAFNALVYALLNYSTEEYGERLWARTLEYRLEIEEPLQKYKEVLSKNAAPTDKLKLAEALLSNPYKRLFKTMHDMMDVSNMQEE